VTAALAGQLELAPAGLTLPLRPEELVDVDPASRGKLYVQLDLHSTQIQCIEQARRMLLAGTYPEPDSGRPDADPLTGPLCDADRSADVNHTGTRGA
jgi:hypothetical protein